jgi:hypothetical protein
MRGDRDKLNRLRYGEEWLRLNNRAEMVVQNLGIVSAFIGDEPTVQFRDYQAQATDLGRH